MKRTLLFIGAVLLLAAACAKKDYMDPSLSPEERTALILKQMTLEEKIG